MSLQFKIISIFISFMLGEIFGEHIIILFICFLIIGLIIVIVGKGFKSLLIYLMILCSFFLGTLRVGIPDRYTDFHDFVIEQDGLYVQMKGGVCREVDRREFKQNVVFCGEYEGMKYKLLANFPRYPEIQFGEIYNYGGILEIPFEEEDFSYKNYLAISKIYGVLQVRYNERVGFQSGPFVYLFKIKNSFEFTLNRIFPEPQASFSAGLLLGSRKGIPKEVMEYFNQTGLTHIIAISGYNITIIIVFVSAMFGFLPRKSKMTVSIIFIIVFVILVGASAAVVRAGIMGIIGLLVIWNESKYNAFTALIFSGFLMSFINPAILLYDRGFHLSFAATAGIIIGNDKFKFVDKWIPDVLELRESLKLTLAATFATLPIIVINFHRFSLVSPLANVLVAPLIPISMLFSFLAAIFYPFAKFISMIFGNIAWFSMELIVWIAQVLAEIPGAYVEL